MFRLITILVAGLLIAGLPTLAQDSAHILKLLNDATTSFNQNNYFQAVSQVNTACGMLRANPAASPQDNYIDIAAQCMDGVNKGIQKAQSQGDVPNATRRIYALQPLVQNLIDWDPTNPRWHYEKGMLWRTLSTTMNDGYRLR
jgi:hypothetical protein